MKESFKYEPTQAEKYDALRNNPIYKTKEVGKKILIAALGIGMLYGIQQCSDNIYHETKKFYEEKIMPELQKEVSSLEQTINNYKI